MMEQLSSFAHQLDTAANMLREAIANFKIS